MALQNATSEEIAAACAELRTHGPFPPAIAQGLAADNPDQMRAATSHLIEAGRGGDLRPLVERFRPKKDLGVWSRLMSSRLHQLAGDFGAGLADIDDLMALFPGRAGAHWFVARARCLEGLQRWAECEAAIREGAGRFPDVVLPLVFLANLLARLKRPAEAVEVWRGIEARFPDAFLEGAASFAGVLTTLGRTAEALASLEAASARLPDDARKTPLRAQIAELSGDWARALTIWDAAGDAAEPQIALGRARALFRLDRVDEATDTLEALLARKPDHVQALRALAQMHTELGEAQSARALLEVLAHRSPEAARPEVWAQLARAHHDLGDAQAGAAALAELERRFPTSALAEGERLRHAKELEHGHEELQARIAAALARFPDDFNLRAHWVWILLSLGRLEEAERETARLEAEVAPGFALTSRLRLEADRGDAALRAYVERFAQGGPLDLADAVQIAYALLDTRTPWAFDLGHSIAEDAARRYPGNGRLNLLRIRLTIARRDDAGALALIDAIPLRYARREFLELRAWAAATRGEEALAKRCWAQAVETSYYAAIDSPIARLDRVSPDDRPGADVGVTAYVVFRNEAAQIPGFLAHHRALGVRRFVFFNHMSDDGGRELALREADVILYDCPDSYQLAWSGRRWVNEIVAREGARGWGLQLDMDEHLIYPGCETVGIDRFVAYLDGRGVEGVRGYMLDVFPARLIDEAGQPAPVADYRYYDDDYYLFGLDRPPYLQPGGGVRARLFEAKEFLHKTPMWRLDAGRLINSHETTHLKFADVSAALLHYKMMNVVLRGFAEGIARAGTAFLESDADVEAIRRHSRYSARLAGLWRADLRKADVSRELEPSLALAARGLMDISEDYRRWLA